MHPVDLLAKTLEGLVTRTGIDPGAVDDVIAGCVIQVGEQAANVGRQAWLAAGFPEGVPRRHHRPEVRLGPAGHGPLRPRA